MFHKHTLSVNKLIKEGLKLENHYFVGDSLTSVKRFYSKITENQSTKQYLRNLGVKERLIRCSSQYAYFAIKNTKNIADKQRMCT